MPKRSDQTFVDLMRQAGELEAKPLKGARLLPLAAIDPSPDQARRQFDIEELAADIASRGSYSPSWSGHIRASQGATCWWRGNGAGERPRPRA
jgi:hypothetical protein